MRWFVEIAGLGSAPAPAEKLCVEAPQWQPALLQARRLRGDREGVDGLTIELLETAYRAIDALSRVVYLVHRAPDDAPLTTVAPAPPAPAAPEPAAAAPEPAVHAPAVVVESPAAVVVESPAAAPRSQAIPPPPPSLSGVPGADVRIDAARVPPFRLLSKREEDPQSEAGLRYREYAYAVSPGVSEDDAEVLLLDRFAEVKEKLAAERPGKLVNLAIFDHVFTGRPQRRPLATLAWKDWKGAEPEIRFPLRDGAPSVPSPSPSSPGPRPSPASIEPEGAPSDRASSEGQAFADRASGVRLAPVPAPSPSSQGERHATVPPPPDEAREAVAAQPSAEAPPRSASEPARASSPPIVAPQTIAAAIEPAPPIVAPQTIAEPADDDDDIPVELVSVKHEPTPRPAAAEPAPIVAEAVQAPPAVASAAASADRPAPASVRAGGAPPPSVRPGAVRHAGEDLLTELFEAFSELHMLHDAVAGARFALEVVLSKLPSEIGTVWLFDINKREFVLVRQVGGTTSRVLSRIPEATPLPRIAMRTRRAVVIADASEDGRVAMARWEAMGVTPRSIVCAPVELGGRYLGLIELANPLDRRPFTDADGHALTYAGQQLGELVASHGVVLDPELILRDEAGQA